MHANMFVFVRRRLCLSTRGRDTCKIRRAVWIIVFFFHMDMGVTVAIPARRPKHDADAMHIYTNGIEAARSTSFTQQRFAAHRCRRRRREEEEEEEERGLLRIEKGLASAFTHRNVGTIKILYG